MVELIRYIKDRFKLTVLLIEHQMGMVMNLCQRLVPGGHGLWTDYRRGYSCRNPQQPRGFGGLSG